MTLKKIIERLKLEVLSGQDKLNAEVSGGYTGDLLSDVIANSKEGYLWITFQTHLNIIAVAKLKNLAGIILVNSRKPEEETLKKAGEEGIPLLATGETAFKISGKLFQLISPKD